MAFYGKSIWDPVLIVAQMVCVQCLFYLNLCTALYMFLASRARSPLTVELLFDYRKLIGVSPIVSYLASALAGSVVLYLVVERTKKCLDFTVTCYVFHLLFCWSYGGFPASIEWWITIGVSVACMTLVGESLCMKKELRDIPTALPTTTRSTSTSSNRTRASNSSSNITRQRLINFLGQ
ncbi:integral membrane protein SYS1-like protein [Chloropicon primus]|uniref:Integral membrane protein SYS1-like protein n=1 Tax=Chloropicon primus TaxID=1764295 RepID=A0A5B8ME00_9CHLO|nr:integral membrane protein SYS1-like protein [Chloropicon primus]UPQ98023.1 integral membrane protein SYS1-like protein [Chloropicon primus]|mmetsp:Transcript_10083/g.28587  ORF Transcript_10083/g.28587 Transcript_10083/m.28587 type:complete len:179 (+) Transcript_10083:274-810(+)|eukprot:QDZ18816.1 integral membrane protein SYS1-like protein [Chloropicon primus]